MNCHIQDERNRFPILLTSLVFILLFIEIETATGEIKAREKFKIIRYQHIHNINNENNIKKDRDYKN